MGNRNPRIPRLVGLDVRGLPLTPTEGFVLSRIDGSATVDDLADLTNLEPGVVLETVQKLIALGAVEWADGAISLPRASLRPGTPPRALDRRAVLSASRSFAPPQVTESQPPSSTREPMARNASVRPSPGVPREPESHEGTPTSSSGRVVSPAPPSPRPGTVMRVNQRERERAPSSPATESARRSAAPPPAREPAGSPPPSPSPSMPPPRQSAPPSSTSSSSNPPSSAGAEVAEIDLPPERRQRIDELYPVLDRLGHYDVLGISKSAELKEIRARYFELSKIFHPDTAFRKNLGPYKARMEAIFSRLTEAYEVLGKKKSRAEYDAYLALQGDTRAAEDAMRTSTPPPPTQARPSAAVASAPHPVAAEPVAAEPAAAEPVAAEPAASSAPPPPSFGGAPAPSPALGPSAPHSSPTPSRLPPEEARRRARELLERRLQGARPSPLPGGARAAVTSSSPPAAPRDRGQIVRDLASTLKAAATLTGGVDRVARQLWDAKRLEDAGDLAGASRELRAAMALAPMRADLRLEHERLSRLLSSQLADKYRQAAEYEERHKKWLAAARSWSKVVEGRPDDFEALVRAANALVEAKGDLHEAQRFAQRACELRPDDVAARRTLGRVYLAAGLDLNARRELERAALLDPGDQIVKNLLGELKG